MNSFFAMMRMTNIIFSVHKLAIFVPTQRNMAVERKCPKCGQWNKNEDYCTNCNTVLSPKIIEEQREQVREARRKREPTRFDRFIERWKNSRFLLVRASYQVLYTIGVIFFAIASFFAWIAASPNG